MSLIKEGTKYQVIEFKEFGDERGNLVVAEGSGFDVPFDIRRVFYTIPGRHDTCFALRVPPVVEAVTACVFADLML